MRRSTLYTRVIPVLLGFATVALIVLPGDSPTLARVLTGWGAGIAVDLVGGYVGGRVVARR